MKLLRLLLGLCPHEHVTWPRTRKRQTTITCLDCAKEFNYDWQAMKITRPAKPECGAFALKGER